MAFPTFIPPIAPSPGGSISNEVRLNEAQFGDGYKQETPQGLNHISRIASLKWDALSEAQADELDAFFFERAGYQPFYYQPFGLSQPLKWKCRVWKRGNGTPLTFSAELKQAFDIDY